MTDSEKLRALATWFDLHDAMKNKQLFDNEVQIDLRAMADRIEQLHLHSVSSRASVKWFSSRMEAKLAANDHKGGWKNCTLQYLSMRLTQERKELKDAIQSGDTDRIINECADIANFALMIADLQLGAQRHGC